jgi:hypothetical protein
MLVIHPVIIVEDNLIFNVIPAFALFVIKVHVEKMSALSDTISKQMANFEKICKICYAGQKSRFLDPRGLFGEESQVL